MQHDEVIWQVIRHNHCSFMTKLVTGNFCRNPYNVTGICNRSSCPLANSRYATIRDVDVDGIINDVGTGSFLIGKRFQYIAGVFYLYVKTIERAHKPNELWERVKLPRNYEKSLELIDKHLQYWPKFLIHKTKQRLTRMTQVRIRMRKLQLKVREKIMTVPRKEKKREARREEKAEKAAVLDKSIEKELLERLNRGVYGDIYNYPVQAYDKILEIEEMQAPAEEEEEPEVEYVEGYIEDEEDDDMEDFGAFVKDESLVGEEEDEYDEEPKQATRKRKASDSNAARNAMDALNAKLKGKAKVLVEVEHDEDGGHRQKVRH